VKSWVEISEERLRANYRVLAEAAGRHIAVLAVVKANAYGHGAAVCAPVLARAGAKWLGVTDAAEGAAVRAALLKAGAKHDQQLLPKLLVMCGPLPEDADAIVRHDLTPVVWEQQQMEWLADAVRRRGTGPLRVHLEIDTGMARQGVAVGDELRAMLLWLRGQTSLELDGVLTHFASAEVAGSPLTMAQRERFEAAVYAVGEVGLRPAWVHAGNSSTVDNDLADGELHGSLLAWLSGLAEELGARAMVRSGLGLYGYCLPIEFADEADPHTDSQTGPQVRPGLQPVMTWKARIIGVRDVLAGDTVGYNATFVAKRPMRLALVPVGYADGLRRELSGSNTHAGGWMLVHSSRAAIVGRVSMNLTVVDVTEIPNVRVGDEVVVLGDGITAEDHARLAGTIAYEIVCGVRGTSRLVE
jgi:alanine racemase